jgi:PIN domain nuclease of toxin-antitoxin system
VRYLLDTHVLIWFVAGDAALSATARRAIESPEHTVFVSAASAWEISTKFRLGKLPGAGLLATNFVDTVAGLGFAELPISAAAAQRAGGMPQPHRDRFDRVLAAQALEDQLVLITNDAALTEFAVPTLW